ncbi:GTP cyclohydrolase I FolE [Tanticharoenia sakaeratensis]|uniref:GTP cyclohydrolase 1 n=1 Tax=Tanticharoenia sakaeratensis NBRC 103193 TaxID=1231623 RepID=A0A0D6MJ87_9PROT|nr:GTP cyclohydrolase I FolE [Tanticharoenia sakaeratensis]GAN53520.1 GTP cyclohydrolase I [Tanticharoenia sakaeratensis NBRC 103193]GBQ17667.1 GTP cyclohydrolase I [Tanticharoenia sakaeratensis NBRC 103193]
MKTEGLRPLGPIDRPADADVRIARAVRDLLEALGEDVSREGLHDTPQRVARMYLEALGGLHADPREPLRTRFVADHHEGPVIVRDIGFHAMCEHHLLPFFGRAHVAYLPDAGVLTGLSKIARTVEVLARRPQLQERLTDQIAQALVETLAPRAVLVVVEAEHLCMAMRGVRAHGARTITMKARGIWADDLAARAEIMALLKA